LKKIVLGACKLLQGKGFWRAKRLERGGRAGNGKGNSQCRFFPFDSLRVRMERKNGFGGLEVSRGERRGNASSFARL
jgi:hypothetical protein